MPTSTIINCRKCKYTYTEDFDRGIKLDSGSTSFECPKCNNVNIVQQRTFNKTILWIGLAIAMSVTLNFMAIVVSNGYLNSPIVSGIILILSGVISRIIVYREKENKVINYVAREETEEEKRQWNDIQKWIKEKSNKTMSLLVLIMVTSLSYSQDKIMRVSKAETNLRVAPHKDSTKILAKPIPIGSQVYMFDELPVNNFVRVIDVASNKEGWVYKPNLTFEYNVKTSDVSPFESTYNSNISEPKVTVYNNTKLKLTLRIDGIPYTFNPNQEKEIPMDSGLHKYIASAPGVLPYSGIDDFKFGYEYKWKFSIKTYYR